MCNPFDEANNRTLSLSLRMARVWSNYLGGLAQRGSELAQALRTQPDDIVMYPSQAQDTAGPGTS